MTHARPIPEGSTSPYPIAEPPHEKPRNLPVVRAAEDQDGSPLLPIMAVVGAGIVGLAAGLFLWRRRR